ncbi:hypothetical protein GCM10022254_61030 [Actinomadura meridiana]|uniref:DUF397 domain-containing protein n=1 Tax=Actinomadura meridiana TaxID=559626 RepID=A0ABP8CII8_9ACTN
MDLSDAVWRKARRSTENGGNCIELASLKNTIAIRDSKNPNGPKLTITRKDFCHLTHSIKNI